MKKRILYWLQNDLRIDDNPILNDLSQQQCELDLVFVINPAWFKSNNYQQKPYGVHKQRFLMQSLYELQESVLELGQTLHIIEGDPVEVLTQRINELSIDEVVYSQQIGVYEQRQISALKSKCTTVVFKSVMQDTLYQQQQLPFELANLPTGFTPFRKKIEAAEVSLATHTFSAARLPPPIILCAKQPIEKPATGNTQLLGGHQAALEHCQQYFSSALPSSYKITRNELDGFDNSTKFSSWLAFGCISAKQVFCAVDAYEAQYGANESTYWIKFELLWREYFKWHAINVKHLLFTFKGKKQSSPLTTFSPNRFAKWCQGSTPYPLVNAIMKELNATGFISNRSRQIVASCLVNELQLDWRYGAAYFEQQLIDYDMASNWGNWQYIAGVGVDPRGGRHFNLQKQTQQYDPHGEYITKWQGNEHCDAQLDDLDAADWPV